jgi:hypothetical protein
VFPATGGGGAYMSSAHEALAADQGSELPPATVPTVPSVPSQPAASPGYTITVVIGTPAPPPPGS